MPSLRLPRLPIVAARAARRARVLLAEAAPRYAEGLRGHALALADHGKPFCFADLVARVHALGRRDADAAMAGGAFVPRSEGVVVVAGLPGAGKTTLVACAPRALDSDALREAWAPRLGRIPYPLWRPLVHARHWIMIWRALKRPDAVIVVRPFTSAWLRRAVLRRARRHHAAVHLIVVDATPAEARAGQRARGRTVGERAMRRHERRWARADFAREPWTSVTHVQRSARSAAQRPRLPSLEAFRMDSGRGQAEALQGRRGFGHHG